MTAGCFIPIKKNSERVPGKNFVKVGGKPLYQIIIEKAMRSRAFDLVVVDSDSEEILEFARSVGVGRLERKPELASDNANGNDLLNHHAETFRLFDLYFQLFATAPLMKTVTIMKAVNALSGAKQNDSVFTAINHHGFFWRAGMPVSYRPGLLPRSQDLLPIVEETTGLYGIRRAALLKYRARIGASPLVIPCEKKEAIDLNTKEDFDYLEWLVSTGRATIT